jgi:hypothetical protein
MRLWSRRGVKHAEQYRPLGAAPGARARGKTRWVTWCTPATLVKSKEPTRLTGADQTGMWRGWAGLESAHGQDGPPPGQRGTLRRLHLLLAEHGKPQGWSVQPTQPAARPANTQGVEDVGGSDGPSVIGGRGLPLAGGTTQPARGLTSHRSSRKRRKQGHGTHGPHGRATSGTERPWRSAHCLEPARLGKRPSGQSNACACGSSEWPRVYLVTTNLLRHGID